MKDFDRWNEKKKKVHNHRKNKFYHPRDIWWCSLGLNVGSEQDGIGTEFQRPVLILKGLGKKTCLVIPLTTSLNKHPMRIFLGVVDNKKASAIISQIRVIDTRRFVNKIGVASKEIFEITKKTVKDML